METEWRHHCRKQIGWCPAWRNVWRSTDADGVPSVLRPPSVEWCPPFAGILDVRVRFRSTMHAVCRGMFLLVCRGAGTHLQVC